MLMPFPYRDPIVEWDGTNRLEPTLAELIDDPLIRLVMASDGVDPHRVRTIFADIARRRKEPRGQR